MPGVDIVAVGRQDLSQSYGIMGQTNHPDIVAAEDYVIKKTLEYGKYPLITSGSPAKTKDLYNKGVLLQTICFDTQFIFKALKDRLESFKAVEKEL